MYRARERWNAEMDAASLIAASYGDKRQQPRQRTLYPRDLAAQAG